MSTDRRNEPAVLHDARADRGPFQVLTFAEAEQADRAYWHAKSPLERWRHQEQLREMNYGFEVVNQGFQRVLAVSERSRR